MNSDLVLQDSAVTFPRIATNKPHIVARYLEQQPLALSRGLLLRSSESAHVSAVPFLAKAL